MVSARSAESAANEAIGGQGAEEALVVPIADAQIYERATVVRPKQP